jgi:hypothetical protein
MQEYPKLKQFNTTSSVGAELLNPNDDAGVLNPDTVTSSSVDAGVLNPEPVTNSDDVTGVPILHPVTSSNIGVLYPEPVTTFYVEAVEPVTTSTVTRTQEYSTLNQLLQLMLMLEYSTLNH